MVSATDDVKKRNGKRHIHMHTAHTRAELCIRQIELVFVKLHMRAPFYFDAISDILPLGMLFLCGSHERNKKKIDSFSLLTVFHLLSHHHRFVPNKK